VAGWQDDWRLLAWLESRFATARYVFTGDAVQIEGQLGAADLAAVFHRFESAVDQ
jgi:hypothetical protein